MSRFMTHLDFLWALNDDVIPRLAYIAENENIHERSVKRFQRDEPPYISSTECSSPGSTQQLHFKTHHLDAPTPDAELLDAPITDEERQLIIQRISQELTVRHAYARAAEREYKRIDMHLIPRSEMWRGRQGIIRHGLLARHCAKHAWQQLGLWNTAWGVPDRNTEPEDDAFAWTWPWRQLPDHQSSPDAQRQGQPPDDQTYEQGLVARALALRRHLRRGEHVVVSPQSSLPPHPTPAQADLFLITRPWFVFILEVAEERVRWDRSPISRTDTDTRHFDSVVAWWQQRGDWRRYYRKRETMGQGVSAWKWRHESPSPEPEDSDFVAVDGMEEVPLEAHPHLIEFTPSEVDAFEMLERPDAEQSDRFWRSSAEGYSFPGQMAPRGYVEKMLGRRAVHLAQHTDKADPVVVVPATGAASTAQPRRSSRHLAAKRAAGEPPLGDAMPAKRQRPMPKQSQPATTSSSSKRRAGRAPKNAAEQCGSGRAAIQSRKAAAPTRADTKTGAPPVPRQATRSGRVIRQPKRLVNE